MAWTLEHEHVYQPRGLKKESTTQHPQLGWRMGGREGGEGGSKQANILCPLNTQTWKVELLSIARTV